MSKFKLLRNLNLALNARVGCSGRSGIISKYNSYKPFTETKHFYFFHRYQYSILWGLTENDPAIATVPWLPSTLTFHNGLLAMCLFGQSRLFVMSRSCDLTWMSKLLLSDLTNRREHQRGNQTTNIAHRSGVEHSELSSGCRLGLLLC